MFQNGLDILENHGLSDGIWHILLSLFASLTRYNSLHTANQIIAYDQIAYRECWDQVVQIDAESSAIQRLFHCTAALSPIGFHRLQQQTSPNGPGEIGHVVQDLNQLFAMAGGLHPYLKNKVQQWAAASGGFFQIMVGKEPTFIPWDEISGNDALYSRVKWAQPKLRSRAIEKIFRSYNCEVSRLLDCCRQVIWPTRSW